MPDRIVEIPGVGEVAFPDSMSPEDMNLAAQRLYKDAQRQTKAPEPPMSIVDRVASLLPTAGGVIGGLAGGKAPIVSAVTAGLGGAAGEGYRQLATHATEIPGALVDVVRNLLAEPRATMRGFAEGATEGVRDAGVQGAVQGGAELVGGAVTKGLASGAKNIYRGYLKPSLAAKNVGKADEIVDTALREALPISKGGAGKADRIIGELKAEVDRILSTSPGSIDLGAVANRVRAFAKQKYYRAGADLSDYQTALGVADRIDNHPALGIPRATQVPLDDANRVKRALQESASSSYGTPNANAAKRATKEGARELRLDIEGATGGATGQVAKLNARESKLIDAARAIKQAAAREANQSKLYGVKTLASIGVGGGSYAQGDDPLTAVAKGAAVRGALSPAVQSGAAILAHRIARELGVGAATASRLAAYVLSEEQAPE